MSVKYRKIKGTNAVVDEDQLKEVAEMWRAGRAGTGGWKLDIKFQAKTGGPLSESSSAAPVPASSNTGQYNGTVAADYSDGLIAPAGRALSLAQVLRQEETSSNLVRIVRDIQDVDGSTQTPEGTSYGLAEEHPQPHDYGLVDTTSIMPTTEDFLQDVPSALSYLTKRLTYLVGRAEEASLVSGNGTYPQMLGLLNIAHLDGDETATTGAVAHSTASVTTAVAKLISDTYTASGCAPEFILMNSATWLQYATEGVLGTAASSGYQAGPGTEPGPRTLWNLPVVWSNAIPAANIVVSSAAAVGRWVHTSGLRVDLSPGYSTYYGSGLIAVRGKVRSTLAYEHPSGVGILTIS